MNLKIKYKILVSMVITVLFTSSILSSMCYFYYSYLFEQRARIESQDSLSIITSSLENDINKLYKDVSYFVTDKRFINLATDIHYGDQSSFAEHYISIQSILENTIKRNNLIESIMLLGKNGEFYSILDMGLKYESRIQEELGHTKLYNGITWLPSYQTTIPFFNNEIMPIVFPITLGTSSNLPLIMNSGDASTLNILVFTDTNNLNHYLQQLNRTPFSTVYLADNTGLPLSVSQDSAVYPLLRLPQITSALNKLQGFTNFEVSYENENYIIYCNPLSMNGLKVVSIISKTQLLSGISEIKSFTLLTFLVSLILSFIISLLVSKTLTLPLKKLTDAVQSIDPSKDTPCFIPQYNDEIGLLAQSFDKMCEVIRLQVACIKEDEKLKHEAEINVLTHQINPHFLYNTLECIHWEILGGNSTNASAMVESLGDFLRLSLSLSSKDNLITIADELKHTQKYIDIINHRTHTHIELVTLVDPAIINHKIVRLIFQPCVENCIKHGFNEPSGEVIVSQPLICIHIYKKLDKLYMTIEDNGKGIDIPKAEQALFNKNTTLSHVGLHNIYERLCVHYAYDIDVEFHTIPFHKNTITFIIPFTA
jgi:two-component system sensor histidine kinase YesM